MSKERLDMALVARGLAESRTRAQSLILAGLVYSGERKLDKPGTPVAADAALSVRAPEHPWVSRGGVKLAHAIAHFGLSAEGLTCLDVGASTGGFTDVLLHHGASKIYAVDVGHGQLDWKLRNDPRVIVYEKTNARDLSADLIAEPVNLVVCDASFIGLKKVLPAALSLAAGGRLVALIKPQFEVGREKVGKGGVVRDETHRKDACADIERWLNGLEGWRVLGLTESPITGPKGNVEYLILAENRHA